MTAKKNYVLGTTVSAAKEMLRKCQKKSTGLVNLKRQYRECDTYSLLKKRYERSY